MDFNNRLTQNRANVPVHANNSNTNAGDGNKKQPERRSLFRGRWFKISSLILLYGGTVLIVAIVLFLNYGSPNTENKYVAKDEMQAVFVNVNGTNGGQVYFGHIKELNSQFLRLQNVFYIQNQASSTTDAKAAAQSAYNLVKLGCELHGPEDEMVINRSQVFFWENLKSTSQVAQKATEFYKTNPNGQQDCSKADTAASTTQATTQAQAATPTTAATSTTPATTTTPTTTKKQ